MRFTVAAALTAAYVTFAVWASTPWRGELEDAIGPITAWVIPVSLAYVPAGVIGFMIFTLLLTRYHPPPDPPDWPAVTVLVAARNEKDGIGETMRCLGRLTYPGTLEVVLADNGSTDETVERASVAAAAAGLPFRVVPEPEPGKHRALNSALETVETPVVVTVDADTWLHEESLTWLVARLAARPQDQHVAACAGALVAANVGATFVTRMQSWDYRLGINGVKRMQAAYNSTLVAQGAFSAYWTADVRAVGGWPDAIGEDIVLTWTLMAQRGLTQYEPVALSFTVVPDELARLTRQRSRWARGMFEGLRANPPRRQPRVLGRSSPASTTSCRSSTWATSGSGSRASCSSCSATRSSSAGGRCW